MRATRSPDPNDDHVCFHCVACDAALLAERLYYRSVHDQLAQTPRAVRHRKFCALHARRLALGEVPDLVAARIFEPLMSSTSRRRAISRLPDRCSVCEASAVAASHAASHATDDICIAHLGETITDLQARALGRALRGADSWQAQRLVLGAPDEGDLATRLRFRALIPTNRREREAASALDELRLRLDIPICPICVEKSRVEARWLTFAAAEVGHGRAGIAPLCASHLDDLTAASPQLAQRLVEQVVATALHDIDRVVATARLKRLDALSNERCAICRALDITADRQGALVRIGLRDERWCAAYEQSRGLCVHHMRGLALAPNRFLTRHLRARAEGVAATLRRGPDRRSALEAATLLDGRTFLGATVAAVLDETESTQPGAVPT